MGGREHGRTDCLDGLEAVNLRQLVKTAKQLIQDLHNRDGRQGGRERRKVHKICEDNRRTLVTFGDQRVRLAI